MYRYVNIYPHNVTHNKISNFIGFSFESFFSLIASRPGSEQDIYSKNTDNSFKEICI